MNTQKLRYFIAAAETLNFTVAAKGIYMAQSTMTEQIKSLEEEVGFKLFNRSRKKLQLTPEGEFFLDKAKALISAEDNVIEETRRFLRHREESIVVQLFPRCEDTLAVTAIMTLKAENPAMRFSFENFKTEELPEALHEGRLDIAFLPRLNTAAFSDLCVKQIGSERYGVILPKDHRLAKKAGIYFQELNGEVFLWQLTQNSIKSQCLLAFAQNGHIPESSLFAKDETCLVGMLAVGMGISILPLFLAKKLADSLEMICVPIDSDDEKLKLFALWDDHNKNPALTEMIKIISLKITDPFRV